MTMNSNAAVFGICSAAESVGGYGSPQPYPTPEQLSAFYSSGGGGGGGGGGNGGDTPPLAYHGPGGIHPAESRTGGGGVIETKYEPNPTSHSPTAGIIASDNGLQYANLDGGDIKGGGGYPGGGGYGGHPHHHQYQAHHASLVQASYAHHYGTRHGARLSQLIAKFRSRLLYWTTRPFPTLLTRYGGYAF
jgi:hypothetical protein